MMDIDKLVDMPDWTIGGVKDGYVVCTFLSKEDAKAGITVDMYFTQTNELFNVIVPQKVIDDYEALHNANNTNTACPTNAHNTSTTNNTHSATKTGNLIRLTDNTDKDLNDSEIRPTTDIVMSPAQNKSGAKRRIKVYKVHSVDYDDGDDIQYVKTDGGTQLNFKHLPHMNNVGKITVTQNDHFLFAVPSSIGRDDLNTDRAKRLAYSISLNGDDKVFVGSGKDGWRCLEHELKYPTKNTFFKSLQRFGLRGCKITVDDGVTASQLNKELKANGQETYWFESDDADFNSPQKTYNDVVGFLFEFNNEVYVYKRTNAVKNGQKVSFLSFRNVTANKVIVIKELQQKEDINIVSHFHTVFKRFTERKGIHRLTIQLI